MKKVLIFLVCLAIGFWGYYLYQKQDIEKQKQNIENQKREMENQQQELQQKKEEKKRQYRILEAARKVREKKLKHLCEDLARRTTLELMQQICPGSGKKSDYKLKSHHLDPYTNTLKVEIHSQWWGKNHMLANDELHEVDTRLIIFGNDKKTFLEITDENEVFKISKQNHSYQQLAQNTLDLGLTLLNEIQQIYLRDISK